MIDTTNVYIHCLTLLLIVLILPLVVGCEYYTIKTCIYMFLSFTFASINRDYHLKQKNKAESELEYIRNY